MVSRTKKALKWIDTIKAGSQALVGKKAGRAINQGVVNAITGDSYAKGGKVKRTGLAKVHAGEVVLTAAQAKSLKKVLK
jgi:hypothetical protein